MNGTALAMVVAAGAAMLPGTSAAASRKPPAHRVRDWAATVAVKPDGAFVIGNPDAKVHLVEYMSLTCPHCAKFTTEASAPLTDNYIRKGLVSLEVRHAVRDGLDFTASLLLRCNGARPFFSALPVLFAAQEAWIDAAVAFQNADQGASAKLPPDQAFAAMARGAGLDRIMAEHGLPIARDAACLADKAEQERLTAMAREAWETRSIPGTPAFFINGSLVAGTNDWATVEARLKDALS